MSSQIRGRGEQNVEAEPPVASFVKSMLIGGDPVNASVIGQINMATKIRLALTIVIATMSLIPFLAQSFRGSHPAHARTLLELSQLTTAVEQYELRNGEQFPHLGLDALVEHLRRAYPYATDVEATISNSDRDLSRLDDAEALVLFLSGDAEKLLGRNGYPVFEFEEARLVDADSDGWLEYRTNDDEIYRYDGAMPFVYLKSLRVWAVTPNLEPTGSGRR